jgi:hypothetical protein
MRVEKTLARLSMRPQITAYLYSNTKKWLIAYAAECGLHRSEVVRLLLERERQVGWLRWALKIEDPAQGASKTMPRRRDPLPPRWNKPPKIKIRRPSRKS